MKPPSSIENASRESAELILGRWNHVPKFAIILGTGADDLAEKIAVDEIIPYAEIPNFPRSTALGHKGELVCGQLAGQSVMAMRGRFHLYEGYPFDVATLPIHVMNRLGVEVLIVSNACGGINPKFASGEIMLIDSHIDLMFQTSRVFSQNVVQGRSCLRSDHYDQKLIEQAMACSRRQDFPLHRGVYTAMLGPNFETRAEYRFIKKIGGDVAGMSTVPEVTVAAQYAMRILGMSIICNIAKPDILLSTSGQEVIAAAKAAGPHLQAIVVDAIERIGS